jgi:hypothetical protein
MSIAHYAPGGKNVLLILLVPGGKPGEKWRLMDKIFSV